MTGPKHLWSGDWQRESAAASDTEADRRQDHEDPTAGGNAVTTPAQTTETAAGNERRNARIAVVATIAVLLIAVVAIAATSGGSAPRSPTTAAAIPTPTQTSPGQTVPNLTIPSPTAPNPTAPAPAAPAPTTPTPTTPSPATPPATTNSTTTAPTVTPQPVSWLGMEILTIPSGAAVVDAITAGGPADRAGITPGDILIEIDHHGVAGSASIARIVSGKHKGDTVTVTVVRGGTSLDVRTTFTGPPTAYP
jgi:membrane-associated protease RseP (regulator of RpoE activity)